MANRSYIYGLKNGKYHSMGEYPYAIPYAYQVLAAYQNSATESHLFDKAVGIKADFKKGREALYRFLDFLAATKEMKNQQEFETQVAKTKEFLDQVDADETLLENGEIYALYTNKDGTYLDGAGLENANKYASEDYTWLGEDIDNLEKFGIQPNHIFHLTDDSSKKIYQWMADLKDNWEEKLGLDSWRNILYFQFTNE